MTNNADSAVGIRAALDAWLTAFNTKDVENFFSLYDPDAVYANAGAPLVVGLDNIKSSFADQLADPTGRISFREETLLTTDDMGLISGTYHFSTAQEDGSIVDGPSGRVALLYRRSDDGRWLLTFDIDNAPPDAASKR